MQLKRQTKNEIVKAWEALNERKEGEVMMQYYLRFKESNTGIDISYNYFMSVVDGGRGTQGRYGQGEQGGTAKLIREWVAANDRGFDESIVDYHKRCEVECTLDNFQYAIRYTPNEDNVYKEKRITELPKRGTYFKEGQKVVIYKDYIRRGDVEGEGELMEFIERGQPLMIDGFFCCVEIWIVRFVDGFETRRRLLCK
jgi:hypothetical protein